VDRPQVQGAQASQPSGTNRPCGLISPHILSGLPPRHTTLRTLRSIEAQLPHPMPLVGVNSARVTPVPIPNTVVKPRRADGTAEETLWESTSSPAFFFETPALLRQCGRFLHLYPR